MAIPVILDTDIGTDIDDTWALAMLLQSPELDLRLITMATGDTRYRAALTARMLEMVGRTDIPIAIGRSIGEVESTQKAWVEGYDILQYPGVIIADAAAAIVDLVMNSEEQITIIAIAPLTNIGDALKLEPRIAERALFIGMQGSINRNNDDLEGAVAEFNVVKDLVASKITFTAKWPMVFTPLDTCGNVRLSGSDLQRLAASSSPLVQMVLENYRVWLEYYHTNNAEDGWFAGQPQLRSSILFDTVAVHLAHSREFLKIEKMGIRVDDEGFTVVDPTAPIMEVALAWEDLAGFQQMLMQRLLGE